MKYIGLILFVALLCSCAPDTPLGKPFYEANKIKVLIGSDNAPEVHYETNNVEKIKEWLEYINESDSSVLGNCNYEGTLVLYFTETDSNLMRFSLNNSCRQITYNVDGKQYTKPLTQKGIDYLESLKRIR
jgi:hypothetical protein